MSNKKNKPTPKQNKWNDPFYAEARCRQGDFSRLWEKWTSMPNGEKKSVFL